jgi:hypothetical protein
MFDSCQRSQSGLKAFGFLFIGGRVRFHAFLWLVGLGLSWQIVFAAAPGTFSQRIVVDQFGYAPDMSKVAVISDPQVGFNAAESYAPGGTLEVRTWDSNTVVYSGA